MHKTLNEKTQERVGVSHYHPEGTSNGSDICDFSKVSDCNGSLCNVKVFALKII